MAPAELGMIHNQISPFLQHAGLLEIIEILISIVVYQLVVGKVYDHHHLHMQQLLMHMLILLIY